MIASYTQAKAALLCQEVVAIPTDTVYGLAALLAYPQAMAQLYSLKKRSLENPMAILVGNLVQADRFVALPPKEWGALTQAFWPGGLTLVVEASGQVPEGAQGTTPWAPWPTVGLRLPNHEVTRKLCHGVGPLVVTSANYSEEEPMTTAAQVEHTWPEIIVIEGECLGGVSSTVLVAGTDGWHILREGGITAQEIAQVISPSRVFKA